jgi:AcrR family transcriptional regulator
MTAGHLESAMGAKSRRRLDPQARRAEILDAAERLLRMRGEAVRVEDVVREAGAAKGTFYLYFPAWEDLLEALRARLVTRFHAGFSIPSEADGPLDWPGLMGRLIEAFVDFHHGMERLHEVIFHGDFARNRPLPAEDSPAAYLAAAIRAGQEAGAFGEVDPEPTARLVFAAMHEASDAIAAGAHRARELSALRTLMARALAFAPSP